MILIRGLKLWTSVNNRSVLDAPPPVLDALPAYRAAVANVAAPSRLSSVNKGTETARQIIKGYVLPSLLVEPILSRGVHPSSLSRAQAAR